MLPLALIISILFCSSSGAQVVPDPMLEGGYFYPRPVHVSQSIYLKPTNLITRETFQNTPTVPLTYHFVTDYPHPQVPENYYIKPGALVANMGVDSKPIYFKKQTHDGNVLLNDQKNILYLAFPVLRDIKVDETA